MLYRDDEEYITLFGIITYDVFSESKVVRNNKGEIIEWLTTKESDITDEDIFEILSDNSEFATNNKLTDDEIKAIINDKTRRGYCVSYISAIRKGDLQENITFREYEETILKARKNLIDVKTIDNIKIIDIRNHIAERIIGDGKGRLPITIDNIIQCLQSSETKVKYDTDAKQVKYTLKKVGKIAINYDENGGTIVTVISKEKGNNDKN